MLENYLSSTVGTIGLERKGSIRMRVDYILYLIGLVCFLATASIAAFQMGTETHLWIIALVVLGFIFLGLGYMQKPTETATPKATPTMSPTPTTSAPTVMEKPRITEETAVTTEELVSELTRVKGIGAKRAEQLESLGIKTLEDLAGASAKKLAAKLEISPKITTKWIANAQELTKKS